MSDVVRLKHWHRVVGVDVSGQRAFLSLACGHTREAKLSDEMMSEPEKLLRLGPSGLAHSASGRKSVAKRLFRCKQPPAGIKNDARQYVVWLLEHATAENAEGCLIWQRSLRTNKLTSKQLAYGSLNFGGTHWSAHRFIKFVLDPPDFPLTREVHADHLCRNTMCVNPDHVEFVPSATNHARIPRPEAMGCGHLPDAIDRRGHRYCRPCKLAYFRVYNQNRGPRQRAKGAA